MFLGFAGHHFTLTASCGVSLMNGLTATGKSSSMCTSSQECFSISARQSTQSSTTSCRHASEKCSRRSCATGSTTSRPGKTLWVSPGWHCAAPSAMHRSATEPPLLKPRAEMENSERKTRLLNQKNISKMIWGHVQWLCRLGGHVCSDPVHSSCVICSHYLQVCVKVASEWKHCGKGWIIAQMLSDSVCYL